MGSEELGSAPFEGLGFGWASDYFVSSGGVGRGAAPLAEIANPIRLTRWSLFSVLSAVTESK